MAPVPKLLNAKEKDHASGLRLSEHWIPFWAFELSESKSNETKRNETKRGGLLTTISRLFDVDEMLEG